MSPIAEEYLDARSALYFASPHLAEGLDRPHEWVGEYARALLEIAWDECRPYLEKTQPAALATSRTILHESLPWSAAWTPELARLEDALVASEKPEEIWRHVAAMLLQMGSSGALPSGEFCLDTPASLFFGNVLLPEASAIAFETKESRVKLTLSRSGEGPLSLQLTQREAGIWLSDCEEAPAMPIVRIGKTPLILHSHPTLQPFPIPSHAAGPLANAPTIALPLFAQASRLLEEASPNFIPWIGEAIRCIVPLDLSNGVRISATVKEFPGLVFLSLPIEPEELAARLAHEASHQFFFALQRLGTLHDGTDTKQYFSPIKKTGRSLELTLFAFHAFGNGALFHRDLLHIYPSKKAIGGVSLDAMMENLRQLDEHLASTRALTEIGRAIWRPLSDSLFHG